MLATVLAPDTLWRVKWVRLQLAKPNAWHEGSSLMTLDKLPSDVLSKIVMLMPNVESAKPLVMSCKLMTGKPAETLHRELAPVCRIQNRMTQKLMARYQKVARLSDSVFVTGLGMEAFMQHIRKQEVISAVKKAFQRAYSMSLSYTPSQAPATVATASPLNIRVFMVAFMVKYYPNTLDRTDDELVQAFQARSTEITAIFDQLSAQLQMQGKWTNSAILQQFPYKVQNYTAAYFAWQAPDLLLLRQRVTNALTELLPFVLPFHYVDALLMVPFPNGARDAAQEQVERLSAKLVQLDGAPGQLRFETIMAVRTEQLRELNEIVRLDHVLVDGYATQYGAPQHLDNFPIREELFNLDQAGGIAGIAQQLRIRGMMAARVERLRALNMLGARLHPQAPQAPPPQPPQPSLAIRRSVRLQEELRRLTQAAERAPASERITLQRRAHSLRLRLARGV